MPHESHRLRIRPRLLAGVLLPLRAITLMAREPETRGLVWLVLSLLLAGTAFFALVEGWSVVDALYFSVITLATVGFGDLVPETDLGKLFTVVYVIVGIGILVAFVSALAGRTVELQRNLRAERGGDESARER